MNDKKIIDGKKIAEELRKKIKLFGEEFKKKTNIIPGLAVVLIGGEYLNEPMNQSLAYNQIKTYEDIAEKRFTNIDNTVYSNGYRSFFDITPDLRFILGKDSKFSNLFHVLGSGQAMKYSPILGESIAEDILGEPNLINKYDYKKFNINRFQDDYMDQFWTLVNGEENTLHRQGKNSL